MNDLLVVIIPLPPERELFLRNIVDNLEPRVLCSAAVVSDFGGLPREVTQIGSTLYFALDEKADGKLKYIDLVAYDLATNTRKSILRSDGLAFGKVRYKLSAFADRLLIAEQYGSEGNPSYELWTLRTGQARAERLLSGRFGDVPEVRFKFGGSAWFTLYSAQNGSGIYVLGGADVTARKLYDRGSFGNQIILGMSSFASGVGIVAGEGFAVGDKGFLYTVSAAGAKPRRVTTLPSTGSSLHLDGSAGRHLLVSAVSSDTRYCYQTTDGVTFSRVAAYSGARLTDVSIPSSALPYAVLNSYEFPNSGDKTSVRVNLDDGATTSMAYFVAPKWEAIGNKLYATQSVVADLFDDEAVGGYAGSGESIPQNFASGDSSNPYVLHIDLNDNSDTELRSPYPDTPGPPRYVDYSIDAFDMEPGAGDFVSAGAITYFAQSDYRGSFNFRCRRRELWSTDGSTAGTFKITNIADGPFAWNGSVYYVPTIRSSTLMRYTHDIGTFEGRVVIDPDASPQITSKLVSLRGRRVYVDYNDNGKFDKKTEPSSITDDFGRYRIRQVPAGKRTIRLSTDSNWEATRGWSKTVKLYPGTGRVISFGLRDALKSGIVWGTASEGDVGLRAFLDLNKNSLLDSNEPSAAVRLRDGVYRYTIYGVSAGSYSFRLLDSQNDSVLSFGRNVRLIEPGQKVRNDL